MGPCEEYKYIRCNKPPFNARKTLETQVEGLASSSRSPRTRAVRPVELRMLIFVRFVYCHAPLTIQSLLPNWGVQITQEAPRRPHESPRKHQRHPGATEGGTQEAPRRHPKAPGTERAPSGHRAGTGGHRWTIMYQKCAKSVKQGSGTSPGRIHTHLEDSPWLSI